MKIELGFGEGVQNIEVPAENIIKVLKQNEVEYDLTGAAEVKRALENPIQSARLRDIVKPGEKIAVISSDITRPMPTWTVMPPVLEELEAGGVDPKDVTLIFGLGSHRPHTEEERRHLAGEVYDKITCVDSDPNNCVHLGTTKAGTPVDIFKTVVDADRVVCLGNLEYHYFAGFSGGAKAIMPGVSTPAAIQVNHKMMLDPRSRTGNIVDNPVRADIEEAADMLGVDFICNVVLDEEKQIIKAVAGDVTAAHREGTKFLDSLYRIPVPKKADIVLVSQGGAPKDLNVYQMQKALDNAKHCVKDGGVIILVGSCRDGLGNATFKDWMERATCPQDLIDWLQEDFKLGGHKAAAIAQVMQRADVYLVSELDPDFVKSIFFTPFSNAQEAYDAAVAKMGSDAGVIVMAHGGSTLPSLSE